MIFPQAPAGILAKPRDRPCQQSRHWAIPADRAEYAAPAAARSLGAWAMLLMQLTIFGYLGPDGLAQLLHVLG
jgi:hypothetical protein